jgi:hypothetical protein
MKKKTIKSYFFKKNYKNPSMETLFCFSKRAVKYKKQLINMEQHQYLDKKTIKSINLYKFYVTNLVLYNQWLYSKTPLYSLFLSSFYCDKTVLNNVNSDQNLIKKQMNIWYKLKNVYYSKLNSSLIKYPKTGMLSSHFVHFVAKKNVTYQARSKYRSKIFNMNSIYYYIYSYSSILYLYLQLLDYKLYFFTSNITKQRTTVDADFNITISNWTISKINSKLQINTIDYTTTDYNNLTANKLLLNKYFDEIDLKKKELIWTSINELNPNINDLVVSSQLIYNTELHFVNCDSMYLREFTILYKNL